MKRPSIAQRDSGNGTGSELNLLLILLATSAIALTFSARNLFAVPAPPDGWQTIKDKTGVCQMSVPPSWATIPGSPGRVASPDHITSILLAGFSRSPAPMSDETVRAAATGKMFENSANRWFYTSKTPAQKGLPELTVYHVNVPISNHSCLAELTVKTGYSEDEMKKIADTVGAAK
jgi:hypothetical protein